MSTQAAVTIPCLDAYEAEWVLKLVRLAKDLRQAERWKEVALMLDSNSPEFKERKIDESMAALQKLMAHIHGEI